MLKRWRGAWAVALGHLFRVLCVGLLASGAAHAVPPPAVAPLPVTAPAPTVAPAASVVPSSLAILETTTPTPDTLRALLQTVTAELAAIPKESKEEGVEQQRTLLQKRLSLLQEFLENVERLRSLQTTRTDGRNQEESLKKALAQLAQQPPPRAPDKPTPEAFKQVQEELDKASQELETLTAQAKERQRLLGQIPEKTLASKERLRQAQEGHQQSRELAVKAEGSKKRLLTLQADNAHLEAQIAQLQGARWEAEQSAVMAIVPLQDKQLEIAQLHYQLQQTAFALYQEALNSRQAALASVRQEELLRREQAAQQASGPEQKFLTARELENARLQKNSADLSKLLTELIRAASEQEQLLQSEKDDLKNVQTLTQQFGTQGLAAEILKDHFKRITRRRLELREPVHPELLEQLHDLQPRLFVMEAALAELNNAWNHSVAEIQAQLPVGQRELFAQQANRLRTQYRQLLNEEKRLLFNLQADGQRLQLLTLERTSTLNAMEGFLLSRIFWIQDAPPLGLALFQQLWEELFSSARHDSLRNLWQRAAGGSTKPLGWAWLGQPVLWEQGLLLALFGCVWVANRFWLAPGGWLERLLHLPDDVVQSLSHSITISLWACLLFLPLWSIFRAAPFYYEALPRLGYTLFECMTAYALYRLIRHDAPLPRHAFAQTARPEPQTASADSATPLSGKRTATHLLRNHWPTIRGLLILFMLGVVLLDMAGYRFGASWLAYNGIRTLLSFFLLIGLYRVLTSAVEALIRRRRRLPTVLAPGARGTLTRSQMAQQINASLRVLFILGGLLLLGGFWGMHEQIFQLFKGWTISSSTGNDGQLVLVTVLDLLRFLVILLVVGWLVKHLPRMYELLLFPWMQLDAGSRYAVLTISRYLIFIVGLLVALNALHLDIAKIGWLVAAISVGIGFGLQEIVANFVSGIILLLERPIRVGDMITIGNSITGRITRINIRATTVLNTDNQEQLIPNRDLITKEVTNWTLANTTLRINIPIGVAYGSDIAQVKAVLLEVARQQAEVLREPAPEALFLHHGPSSLDFELRVFLPDPSLRWQARDRLNTAINQAFTQHGIRIPFPQQEVHIHSMGRIAGSG
ncbi:MAG: mechanosensitive ion channel [Magnetococcus sp. MYC-9]